MLTQTTDHGVPRREAPNIMQLLDRWEKGDKDALSYVFELVYWDLRRIAHGMSGRFLPTDCRSVAELARR